MTNNEELANKIPRTAEELEEIKSNLNQDDTQKTLDKAYTQNERIGQCRKMTKMFETEEFQLFWETINVKMKEVVNVAVPFIKGDPKDTRYDPLGQLVQLNNIQGGLEMLESQEIQKKIIEDLAKGEIINTEELESKLKIINNNKTS